MREYLVRYEVDAFDVMSPREAAAQVARRLLDGDAAIAIFDIVHQDGTITRVDLSEEDE